MQNKRIYLDWNAASPILDISRQSFIEALDLFGNPSSVHMEGQKIRSYIENARGVIADFCGAKYNNIVFTSCATESANLVLTPNFYKGSQEIKIESLYVSDIEHHSIYEGGRFPADKVHKIQVLPEGIVNIKSLSDLLNARDCSLGIPMVAVMFVNNVTGVIQPIKEISDIVKKHDGILVVDAVQAAGKISIDIDELGADFLIISSYKIGGPIGAGALVFRDDILFPKPLLLGGGHEKGHRAGTENFPAIYGFAAAAKEMANNIQERSDGISKIMYYLEENLKKLIPNVIIHGKNVPRVSNTCCFSVPYLKAEVLQVSLDLAGIAISIGSACSSGKVINNHVLSAMGYDMSYGAVRISCGHSTRQEDIEFLLKAINNIVN
ncbi:cysteine desulfurase family protein [Candidatus Liberibacter americanus]|uniref:Cysteine desulfurase n=1 Tax=Candidatus Liberibacter americanus str. Sao Paulo TaxID=1261131 RepID=U6B4H8_9HYPH|nr:cysteine desulfurase family protein [Candidatus Liberibacter americanus]AHA27974.1 Cysteine sulfinate desulfinase/cysteine desulfurase [Candidatus Liberibacter americanus str. Sao Paulo]EMS35873.1 putative pyridoxal-phosphate-dependent aminotransferase protein [Candidatus Liberibacter americanus PW_SP]